MKISNNFIKYSQTIVIVGSVIALISSIFVIKNKYTDYAVINGYKIKIQIADDENERQKGHSNIKSIKDNFGLLFEFDSLGKYPFWNKEMQFPIDLVWIQGNTVIGTDYLPKPATSLTTVSPPQEINLVLEINAGLVKKYNIKPGDNIELHYE